MNKPVMPLHKALTILADIHTDDDEVTGFRVEVHPHWPHKSLSQWSMGDYIRAWESVRANLNRRHEP